MENHAPRIQKKTICEPRPGMFACQWENHQIPARMGRAGPVCLIIHQVTGASTVITIKSRTNHNGMSAGKAAWICDGSSIHAVVSQNP